MNLNKLVLAGVVVAVVLSVVAVVHSGQPGPQGLRGNDGLNGHDGADGINGIDGRDGKNGSPVFGATATLDNVNNPYVNISGNRYWYGIQSMGASSTNFCGFRNPFNSTSTVEDIHFNMTNDVFGAVSFDVSTSSNSFASSSPVLGRGTLGGVTSYNTWKWVPQVATTTVFSSSNNSSYPALFAPIGNATNGTSPFILAPSEWVTLRYATSSAGGSAAPAYSTGTCNAIIKKL